MKKKISLIGFGNIGKEYFKNIKKDKNLKLVSVADKKIKKIANVKFFKDYKEMFKKTKTDVLIVATNVKDRMKILVDAKKYNFKNIICEKPIVESYKQLIKLRKVFNDKKIKIHTHYTRKYLNEFNLLKNEIIKNKKNKILFCTFYYSKGIFHNGVHFLDLVIDFFGIPEKASLISKNNSNFIKNDYLLDFVLYFKNFKIFFISFENGNMAFSDFKILCKNSKIEITSKRTMEFYIRKENELFSNLDEYKLFKTKKINYKKSFKNILNSLNSKNSIDYLKREYEIYSLINNILKKKNETQKI